MQSVPDTILPVIQLGAFGLLAFGILWLFHKGIPLYFETERERAVNRKETAEMFVNALREAREYHRQDSEMMRSVVSQMEVSIGKQVAGLARAIERNTIAHVASAKGDDPQIALDRYTNGQPA